MPGRRTASLIISAKNVPDRDRYASSAGAGSVAKSRNRSAELSQDFQRRAQDLAKSTNRTLAESTRDLRSWWEQQEEKPLLLTIGALGVGTLVLGFRVVDLVDNIPFFGSWLEFVGLIYSAWFVYSNLLFKPDRKRFTGEVQQLIARVIGNVEHFYEETGAMDLNRGSDSGPGDAKNAGASARSRRDMSRDQFEHSDTSSSSPGPRYPSVAGTAQNNGREAQQASTLDKALDQIQSGPAGASPSQTMDRDIQL